MISTAHRDARPAPSLSDTLSDLLHNAGLDKADTIRVTGPGSLPALLWFCRHGYEQVGCIGAGQGHGHSEDGDLLLVPQTRTAMELEDLLRRGPRPRPGGVLIVQTPQPSPDNDGDPVHDLLGEAGYVVERCLHGAHRELHVARRRATPEPRLAA